MRILFTCGSTAPGQDGVGDYTQRLAGTLSELGYDTTVQAMLDPARGRRAFNGAILQAACRRVSPQHVSVQIVPWTYQRWGVLVGLGRTLNRVIPCGFSITLHEIWMLGPTSRREHLLARLQRWGMVRSLRQSRASAIFVTSEAAREALAKHGVTALLLPLFSNIPVSSSNAARVPNRLLFFGSAPRPRHFGLISEQVVDHIALRPLQVVLVGNDLSGYDGLVDSITDRARSAGAPLGQLEVLRMHRLSPDEVSRELQTATAGFARNDPQLLPKSGTLHAMLEHGLPVWAPLVQSPPSILGERGSMVHARLVDAMSSAPQEPVSRVRDVARMWLDSI